MTKRPDQHNLDPDEAGATDYKFRRKSQDQLDRDVPDVPPGPETADTPREVMDSRRRQAEADREDEQQRARRNASDS